MKAIVLGMGLQGKAVIHDLEQSNLISRIFAADINLENAQSYLKQMRYSKTEVLKLDVSQGQDLAGTYSKLGIDIVICMLPIELALTAAQEVDAHPCLGRVKHRGHGVLRRAVLA